MAGYLLDRPRIILLTNVTSINSIKNLKKKKKTGLGDYSEEILPEVMTLESRTEGWVTHSPSWELRGGLGARIVMVKAWKMVSQSPQRERRACCPGSEERPPCEKRTGSVGEQDVFNFTEEEHASPSQLISYLSLIITQGVIMRGGVISHSAWGSWRSQRLSDYSVVT